MSDWRDIAAGPAVVAERDQFEAELRDVVSESQLLFCVAAGDSFDVCVRGLYALGDDIPDDERTDAIASFLLLARGELERMLDDLGDTI